jgi:hypothetical protein
MTTSTVSATAATTRSSPGRPVQRTSDPSLVGETVRALNGYYGRLGRIGLDLARALVPVELLRDAAARLPIEVTPMLGNLRRAAAAGVTPVASSPGARRASAESPTLLVEADGDRPGFGVFLVENLTAEPVSAPITVSTFVDEHGREVRPRLVLRPATVSLGPGEQAMVQLAAELDGALESGVRYRGEIAIPALSNRRIPIVLRRRAAELMDDGAAVDVQAGPAPATPASARRHRTAGAPAQRPAATAAKPRRGRVTSSPDEPR